MGLFNKLLNPPEASETLPAPCLSLAEQLAECEINWRETEREYNGAAATLLKHVEKHQECPLIFCSGNRANVLMAVASPETRSLRSAVVEIIAKRNALLAQRADLQKKLGVIR